MEQLTTESGSIVNDVRDLMQYFHRADRVEFAEETDGRGQAIVLPVGLRLESVEPFLNENRGAPRRRRGTAHHQSLESFIDHALRFKDVDSAVFVDVGRQPPKFVSVLNYHREGHEGTPRFGDHRGVYDCTYSDEWKAWSDVDGKPLSSDLFAQLVEDRIADISEAPADLSERYSWMEVLGNSYASAAKLLELSRGLQVHANHKVKNATNLATGEISVVFEVEHDASERVPPLFWIEIPVFKSSLLSYKIPVRLRYRLTEGRLVWFTSLYRPDLVFADAIDGMMAIVADKTDLVVFAGTPES